MAIKSISRSRDNRNDERTVAAILNLVNILLVERADTRSWQTLPGRIYMTRMFVPAGTYTVELEACGGTWADFAPLTVDPGTTRYVFRDLRYPVPPRVEMTR